MNLLLLEAAELGPNGSRVTIHGRRARHVREVLRADVGDELRVGILDGPLGQGTVVAIADDSVSLSCTFGEVAPEPPSSRDTLLLAVPRPKVLQRCLAHAAALGFGRIVLFRTWRVDKSHLASKVLREDQLRTHLVFGLEQSRRTRLPEVSCFPLFKPFVEDRLEGLVPEGPRFVAHPTAPRGVHDIPADQLAAGQPFTLALGPEGGFIPYEVERLEARGFVAVSSGQNPLRVETALAVLTGQISLLRELGQQRG